METERTCEECGAELPANAPQGLCPRCLARMGLGLVSNVELSKSDFQIERTGTMIGRYKLLEKIGEGGFGVVFMAEQVEPVQRRVALKIIKAGMDTKEVIARFEAERQAIALMDHPNIARALDAGATEAGRPYFVMELVQGIPITDYCDRIHLSTRDRLQLFMKVCQAVQHAHQKGVIHRDIKPSNVLVTEHDGEPVPKVIDFGVAKALGQKLTEKTLFTGFHHLIGTPAYMSPEQAALSGLDIDTRADIYSLGVLLYELLTGVTPFDADTLRKAALDEIRRMIQETEPEKPSTRLRTLGGKLTDVAKHRCIEPAGLGRLLRGDLDWIVMRCLEKDRKRRYETANDLAADVGRHLDSEPVLARSPGNLYRFQKLIRRHKVAFVAVGAVIAALLIGLGMSTWLYFKEREARQKTAIAEREQTRLLLQAESERQKAQTEAGRSQQVAHYLKNVLNDIAPALAKGCTKKHAQEVLAQADERVGRELHEQPDLEAVVRTTLAEVQQQLGQFGSAETNLGRVVTLRKKAFGKLHPEVATALDKLAEFHRSQGQWTEAEGLSREATGLWEQLARDHPKSEDIRRDVGQRQWQLGHALAETGRREAAVQVMSDAARLFEKAARDFPGNRSFREDQAVSHRTLGDLLHALGQVDEAERHSRKAIGLYAALKAEAPENAFYHTEEARTTWVLAARLEGAGRTEAAAAEYRRSIALQDSHVQLRSDAPELAGAPPATNLIFNGSFELPAYDGHGRTFSSVKSFDLPGWTFSKGDIEFFLEYGEPQNVARYADGRQAVSLNGDGRRPPIMLAQTFPTTPGETYTLMFAQGDEQMEGPSTSELTVNVAGVQRVFSREHDTGMVFKTLHFTAGSNLTTLRFADTTPATPDIVHSPFLDAVAVVLGSVEAPVVHVAVKPSAMQLVGKPVPKAFKLPLLTGGEIELPPATNRGLLLLDFCASWCGPCREAMPVLANIAKDYSARGVRYVTVNQGEAPETIRRYLAKAGLDVSVALDHRSAVDPSGWCAMAKAFRVEAIPTIVIVDRTNIIRYIHVGNSPELGVELRGALDEALRE